MKKLLTTLMAIMMIASLVLTGCSKSGNDSKTTDNDQSGTTEDAGEGTDETATDETGTDEAVTEAPEPGVFDEPVTLSYLAWNLGTAEEDNLERKMLAKFQEVYPNVTINIVEVPLNEDGTAGNYGDYLNTLASQKALPDVYMWTSVPDTASAGWAADVSEYATADTDYQNVVAAVRDGGQVNGKTYGIPFQMHLFGIMQNYNIYEELNIDPLPYSYTLDDLLEKIAATTTDTYRGIDNFAIEDWGALVNSDTIGFGTFDGEKYNFSSEEFAKAINTYKEVVEKGYTGNGSFTGPWLPEGVNWAWGEGYIANQYEASWAIPGFQNGERPFKSDLIPLPNEKVVLVPDFIFVAANTANAQAAYELAKWMSFGVDGMKARMAIKDENGIVGYSGLPLNAGYDAEIDEYFLKDYADFPMFLQVYASLKEKPENVYVEGFKVIPGYTKSRFDGDTGVVGTVNGAEKSLTMSELIISIIKGEKQLSDYAVEMDKVANNIYNDAKANLPK
ncbi:MAG: extracellular solute-binding protein family 1 [Herbinix sp.]|jgi:ABC-type glycerol-3-phosphate transport system substrate-binding protein|nr:extracellular solute-binding protein family 1 [Herbinix sp.]